MSVVKLLSRIVAPEQLKNEDLSNPTKKADLHDHTYGITSDPLTQFAVLLSALVSSLCHLVMKVQTTLLPKLKLSNPC